MLALFLHLGLILACQLLINRIGINIVTISSDLLILPACPALESDLASIKYPTVTLAPNVGYANSKRTKLPGRKDREC